MEKTCETNEFYHVEGFVLQCFGFGDTENIQNTYEYNEFLVCCYWKHRKHLRIQRILGMLIQKAYKTLTNPTNSWYVDTESIQNTYESNEPLVC